MPAIKVKTELLESEQGVSLYVFFPYFPPLLYHVDKCLHFLRFYVNSVLEHITYNGNHH